MFTSSADPAGCATTGSKIRLTVNRSIKEVMDIRNAAILYLTNGAAPSRTMSWAIEHPLHDLAWQTTEHKPAVYKLTQQFIGYDAANTTFCASLIDCRPWAMQAGAVLSSLVLFLCTR